MKNKTNIIHKINSFKNNVIEGKKESSKPKKSLKNIETKISPESIQKINLLSNDSKKTPNLCTKFMCQCSPNQNKSAYENNSKK